MNFIPGPTGDRDFHWVKEHRVDLFLLIGETVIATLTVVAAFVIGGWLAGLVFLTFALFVAYALLYMAPGG